MCEESALVARALAQLLAVYAYTGTSYLYLLGTSYNVLVIR
jgi:hypothetical protein